MSDIADLLERYRRGAEVVAVAATGAAGPQLDYQPGPGKWSVRQILGHLADAELLAAARFRRVIAEENPRLLSYDQDAWATKLNYQSRRVSEVMDLFRKLRAVNHQLLKDLPPESFSRSGTHDVEGVMTLLDLVKGYAEHTEKHAAQMQETRRLYKESRAQA